jgi:NCS2 family nucleobase:cation symporter-2
MGHNSFFLIIMGIFAKFAAALVAIPSPVIGGMTTFLFCSVAVSGLAIISRGVPFNRRNRFILTAGFSLGFGATLVPTYFSHVFTYSGDNKSLQGFLDAIVLVMETGFAVAGIVCMILNLTLPPEIEETAAVEDPASEPLAKKEDEPSGEAGSSEAAPVAKETKAESGEEV